jgi:hypothetical protein
MVENVTKYSELSKEMMMNVMSFAERMNIKNLILLLDRKNKDYIKILQGMMTVGFDNDKTMKCCKIAEKEYKIMKMTMKSQAVEEIPF